MWFILVEKEEKVNHEVTDGYGKKVLPGQSFFISGWFLECTEKSKIVDDSGISRLK